jgi:hypothetical protein
MLYRNERQRGACTKERNCETAVALPDAVGAADRVAPSFDLIEEFGDRHQPGLPEEGAIPLRNLFERQPLKIDEFRNPSRPTGSCSEMRNLIADVDQEREGLGARRFDEVARQAKNMPVDTARLVQSANDSFLQRLIGFRSAPGEAPVLPVAHAVLGHQHGESAHDECLNAYGWSLL